MREHVRTFVFLVIACVPVPAVCAQGATLKVHCGGKGQLSTISGALKLLDPSRPNTIIVSGTCKEDVLIQGFSRLALLAKPAATITDASGGAAVVVDIEDSTDVILQGFTVNGGANGISCANFSLCRLSGDTIQGAVGVGVFAYQSRVGVDNTIIQDNFYGLVSLESSSIRSFGGLLIQRNVVGVDVDTSGSFASFGDTVQNNLGDGIGVTAHGSVLLLGTTVTGNSGTGVSVTGHAAADFEGGNVVTANGGDGVLVKDSSFAEFRTASMVTANASGLDVDCQPQFPATRGALTNTGGGITNCVEP